MQRSGHIAIFTIILNLASLAYAQSPYIEIANREILPADADSVIYSNNQLNEYFDDTVFQSQLKCRNNNLQLIDNKKPMSYIYFNYQNIPIFTPAYVQISVSPNDSPWPTVASVDNSQFLVVFNCEEPYTARNYWNEVKVALPNGISFSFLLNCDPENRHKQFEVGYLLLSIINAAIIVGVAMHSYAWSIKINLKPLRVPLKWVPFLIFSVAGDAFVIMLLRFSPRDSSTAFDIIRYLGVIVSIPCVFICLN
jgi:hypothetical protein